MSWPACRGGVSGQRNMAAVVGVAGWRGSGGVMMGVSGWHG